jgi:CBS domain-containing protein
MPRTDVHLDAMLRHLGAAYYESLHGRATRVDVARALDTVEDHLHEQAQRPAHASPGKAHAHEADQHENRLRRPGGWARRVGDVMTSSVVTVDRLTPYKEIARLLAEHRISGLPVLKMGRQVVGVVTEADLLAAEVATARRLRSLTSRSLLPRRQQHPALTAAELMTAPAITIGSAATVPAAARLMDDRHVRRLPVVDDDGKLVGVVSRRDLLSVFLRSDEEITADVRRVLDDFLLAEPDDTDVTVRNGIVTLTGTPVLAQGRHADLLPVAIRLMWDVDGVVDIIDKFGEPRPAEPAAPAEPTASPSREQAAR